MGSRIDRSRSSPQTLKVVQSLLEHSGEALSGADLQQRCGIASGTLYPILLRLEAAGWLTSHWETTEPLSALRPRRRLYRLTSAGLRHADDVFANSHRGVFA